MDSKEEAFYDKQIRIKGRKTIELVFSAFYKYPKLTFPLLFLWFTTFPIIYFATKLIKLNWKFQFFNVINIVLVFIISYFLFCFLITIGCSFLLELIQQIESNKKVRVIKSLRNSINHNTLRLFPLILEWSLFSVIVSPIDFFLNFIGISILKGFRMTIFLVFPAIAWRNISLKKAKKEAIELIERENMDFSLTFIVIGSIQFFAIPIIIWSWIYRFFFLLPFVLIIILAFLFVAIWCFMFYVEQFVMAELYLWFDIWKKECKKARKNGEKEPWSFWVVPKPKILDSNPDLLY